MIKTIYLFSNSFLNRFFMLQIFYKEIKSMKRLRSCHLFTVDLFSKRISIHFTKIVCTNVYKIMILCCITKVF